MKKLKSVFYVMLLLLILGGVIGAIRFISSGNDSSIATSEDTGKVSIDEIIDSSESSSTSSIVSISWGELN